MREDCPVASGVVSSVVVGFVSHVASGVVSFVVADDECHVVWSPSSPVQGIFHEGCGVDRSHAKPAQSEPPREAGHQDFRILFHFFAWASSLWLQLSPSRVRASRLLIRQDCPPFTKRAYIFLRER